MSESEREKLGLPPRVFLYTLDQISTMLQVDIKVVKAKMLHYERRSVGTAPKSKIRCINIMPEGETPEWRVTEREFIRYLKNKGVRVYERGHGI